MRTQDVFVVLAGLSAGPCSNLDFYAHLSGPDRCEFQVQIPRHDWRGLCCPGSVSCDCVDRTSAAWLCEDPAEGAVIGSGGGGLLKF